MKKIAFLLLIVLLLLTGCGSGIPENSPDLKQDISEKLPTYAIQEPIDIISVTSNKRNTDIENKRDEIYVTVNGNCTTAECEIQYKLVYNYYTEGGWILDELIPINTEQWKVNPTSGVDAERLESDMQDIANYGYSTETYFNNVSVSERNCDLGSRTETVKFDLAINSAFRTFSAKLISTYKFVSGYDEGELWWYWESDYASDEYRVLKDDYASALVGEWYEAKYNRTYTIEQLSQNEFRICDLGFFKDVSSAFYMTFNLTNDKLTITEWAYKAPYTEAEHISSYCNGPAAGAFITLNSDGSIDVDPSVKIEWTSVLHLVKK